MRMGINACRKLIGLHLTVVGLVYSNLLSGLISSEPATLIQARRSAVRYKFLVTVILLPIVMGLPLSSAVAGVDYRGVNLSIAEFGSQNLPGTYGVDYIYPTNEELDYFIGKGMNTFRLPFRWERLQQTQFADLFSDELTRMHGFVNEATGRGATVILDPHNFSRYYGSVIGEAIVPTTAFADFWSRLATEFKTNPKVIFGLINEPHTMSSELWLINANSAISAIRETGATNLILVPGNAWSGAHSWYLDYYGTPNSVVMLDVVDPLDNFAIEVHQYLDQDHSGTSPVCINSTIGSQRLMDFTQWLLDNDLKGFLGEFGGGTSQTCLEAIKDMLIYVQSQSDLWLGWTYWAAGPWWGNYFTSIEPAADGSDKPQMDILEPHLERCNGKYVTINLNLGQIPTPNADVIIGTSGADTIKAKAGNDTVCGMGGDDSIYGNSGDDWIDGGEGIDNLRGGQGNDVLYTGTGATTGTTSRAFGGHGDDEIYGGPDADDLRGGRGADTIYGNEGDDAISGNGDNDTLWGGTGHDTLNGGIGDDLLAGQEDDDSLYGGADNDELDGGAGDVDVCDGGGGDGDTATVNCEVTSDVP